MSEGNSEKCSTVTYNRATLIGVIKRQLLFVLYFRRIQSEYFMWWHFHEHLLKQVAYSLYAAFVNVINLINMQMRVLTQGLQMCCVKS